jgi:hypothetical protein
VGLAEAFRHSSILIPVLPHDLSHFKPPLL